MANIHIYKGTLTSGGTNGTLVSEGTGLVPITVGPLNASNNQESTAITLALRCDTGYVTSGNTIITPTGTTAAKWALSVDNVTWGGYGAALTISSAISATNTLFYAKAKATSDEPDPVNDATVDLAVSTLVAVA